MKYLIAILSILILIAGCSSTKTITGSAMADIEAEQANNEIQPEPAEPEKIEQEPDYSISIVDKKFEPKFMTVPVGTTVTWTHNDDLALKHMVIVKNKVKSNYLFKGDTYQYTFDEPGKYLIQDPIYLDTAVGQITVE